ncbi:molybdenum cofactor guanylyltransferase [Actinomadura barringtoniae]|uniref:Molybdenum cofactor guanylyltransferase n=1 Tax=Actinomadura barringtoniae TaxID=1427535 RepID=A0A939PC64_9ACTN|nr:molybdenum cofactor guanylyltransferase [Actinomadura barringtoniae]MBO2449925.1 molybdenum cofactor guanylyltransferase [Actinomadura barringtoniae]
MAEPAASFDAVVLAGGRARRFGGADKPAMPVGGRPLISCVVEAVSGAEQVVVVGPQRPGLENVIVVREDPPGAGPVPALRTGLARVRAPRLVLLAADLPFITAADVDRLLRAVSGTGAVMVDDDGREQWLTGAWRTDRLAAALDGYDGASLRGLLAPLAPVTLASAAGERQPWYDCDTPEELARAERLAGP